MKNIIRSLYFYKIENYNELPIDYYETDNSLIFEIDLPGIDPEKMSLNVYENLLIIEGFKRDDEDETEGLKYLCMERNRNNFKRVIKIPIPVDTTSGEAIYESGVLTIKFPKLKGKLLKINVKRS
jgi:HSP20 family protein